jgi:hypothetical protein
MSVLLAFLTSSVSSAEEPRYGWQIAVPEAAGFVAGGAVDEWQLPGMSIGTMGAGMVAGPTVHWAHGRVIPGVLSVVGWTFVPPTSAVGGIMVECVASDLDNGCATQGARVGTLTGAAAMALADTLLLPKMKRSKRFDRTSGVADGYGTQILAVDAAGLAFGVYIGARRMEETDDPFDLVTGVGVGMYTVGFFVPPLVHAFHRNWEGVGADIALRWLGPPMATLPGIMGWCSATGGSEDCIANGALAGLAISSLVVSSFDAQVLAREKRQMPMVTPTASLRPPIEVLPRMSVTPDGASAGVAVLF